MLKLPSPDGLYNRALSGIPSSVSSLSGEYVLKHTYHAQCAAKNDKYGEIILPATVDLRPEEIVELEIESGLVSKVVLRTHYDDLHDLCLVLAQVEPETLTANVKTVWLNEKTDHHKTLKLRCSLPSTITP